MFDVDAQRARWERYRVTQAMTIDAGDRFALGGLGRHVDDLSARLLFLPSDPAADVVPLGADVLAWLRQERQAPYGGKAPSWGHQDGAATDTLILYDQSRDAGWRRYLALHRHGGIEVGLSRLSYEVNGIRAFRLRTIVGIAWVAAALQVEVAERWRVSVPFEIVVGLRNTRQASLGEFAEGWANPGMGLSEHPRCLDEHVLLRQEADIKIDPQQFAIRLGDRIEQAFGSIMRRHLARVGQYKGNFDHCY